MNFLRCLCACVCVLFGGVRCQENTTLEKEEQSPTNGSVETAATLLFHNYWEMTLRDSPEYATSLGDPRYDDRLTSKHPKAYEKRKVMYSEFLEQANQLLQQADEGSDTHDNLRLFVIDLQYHLDNLMIGSHLFPVSSMSTPQMRLHQLVKYAPLNSTRDFWNLIARYRAYPTKIDEQIELMREGIRTNMTLNEHSMIEEKPVLLNAEESPFYKPFVNLSRVLPEAEAEDVLENATDALENHLLPSLQKMQQFMQQEYRRHLRPALGVDGLPNGHEYYLHKLRYHLTDNNITAQEVHDMGLKEVERISREMRHVIHSLGFNMSQEEFSDYLRRNESHFFESEEDALNTYRDVIEKEITPKLSMLFESIPSKKLTVESIPGDANSGPRAYYMRATPDGSKPAIFYVDTSSLENLPKYEVMTLALHEGVPGHHFQISYAIEQDSVPEFRKYEATGSAFIEGWALYAEYLGYEMGLYEDPYMLYGHLSEEMFRACRMVVDTGMHVLGWSREEAIDFMMRYSAATLGNIQREVDRYITWPGQACAYKYGELKIKELRKRAEQEMGSRFDIREFHDVVLRNAGPLHFVEEKVDSYIRG